MKGRLIALLGWYGVLAVLTGYALVSFRIIPANGYLYQLLNLTGALGIVAETASKKDTQPAVLNLVWAVIALIAIIRLAVH